MTRTETAAAEAREMVTKFRAEFQAAPIGTNAYRAASESLDFWIGRSAMLAVMVAQGQ